MRKITMGVTTSLALCLSLLVACSDWTKPEPEEFPSTATTGVPGVPDPPPPPPYDPITDPKYVALREWKATPGLPQVFVWFDDWAGGTEGQNSMTALPDSVTIISNWGQPKWGLTPAAKADMEYVQKVKGTKVVVTLFSSHVGDDVAADPIYNIGDSSDETVVRPAIAKYAEALHDAVVAEGYDGYDWDYEPNGGGGTGNFLWVNRIQRRIFVEELSYWFGKGASDPMRNRGNRKPAKPDLLFLIDGEIGIRGRMDKDWLSYYVDYFVLQAYNSTTTNNMNNRVTGVIDDMSDWIASGIITKEEVVHRTILTENFESYAESGGGVLDQSKYVFRPTSGDHVGVDQQIGGFGLYRVGFDFYSAHTWEGSKEYGFLRHGISNIYNVYKSRLP